jgi:hypothetical protein
MTCNNPGCNCENCKSGSNCYCGKQDNINNIGMIVFLLLIFYFVSKNTNLLNY